uniref:Uncharacterized protein n=1 Tax=Phaeomonas parva TaxID=124430 RepID=A0A7S1TWF7_9STRA|mmetsp:Transcript_17928/g.54852  ORF Transcript_17928/g.54852 Transcript_17928/m.54852 type:complete len:211 (+) Transcript_17928:444-1076(+)
MAAGAARAEGEHSLRRIQHNTTQANLSNGSRSIPFLVYRALKHVMDFSVWRGMMTDIANSQRQYDNVSDWSGRLYGLTFFGLVFSWVCLSNFTINGVPRIWSKPVMKLITFFGVTVFFCIVDYFALKHHVSNIEDMVERYHHEGRDNYLISAYRKCGYICAIFIDVPPPHLATGPRSNPAARTAKPRHMPPLPPNRGANKKDDDVDPFNL